MPHANADRERHVRDGVGHVRRRRVDRQRQDRRARRAGHHARQRRPHDRRHAASTSSPAASTRTRTSTCRSAAPPRSDDFEIGHARGGARRHDDDRRLRDPEEGRLAARRRSTPGTPRPRARRAIDYAFHMITTDVHAADARRDGRDGPRGRDRRSRCSWPIRACSSSTISQIFRAMLRAGELGALICMHAETGLPIDVLVERALADGPHRADLSRADAARGRRGDGHRARDRLAEMAKVPVYIVHLSAQRALERVMEARDRGLPAYAETCPQYLFLSRGRSARQAGRRVRRRQVRVHAAAAPEASPRSSVARPAQPRPAGRLDRPLPVLHEGAEGARQRTTSRRSRTACRASRRACTCCTKACATGSISLNRFVEITSTAPAKIFGLYRRRARSPSAPMPTSSCGIRRSASSSRTRTCTCRSTTPPTKARRSSARRRTCCRAAS